VNLADLLEVHDPRRTLIPRLLAEALAQRHVLNLLVELRGLELRGEGARDALGVEAADDDLRPVTYDVRVLGLEVRDAPTASTPSSTGRPVR
jgi:hypothetical protein